MQLFEDFELVNDNDNDNDHVNVCHFILKKGESSKSIDVMISKIFFQTLDFLINNLRIMS